MTSDFWKNMTIGDVLETLGTAGAGKLFEPTVSSKPHREPQPVDLSVYGQRFVLQRHVDESGVSGTGSVATGIRFPDGHVALRWNTKTASTGTYASIDDVQAIHGHGGATKIVWID